MVSKASEPQMRAGMAGSFGRLGKLATAGWAPSGIEEFERVAGHGGGGGLECGLQREFAAGLHRGGVHAQFGGLQHTARDELALRVGE